MVGWGNLVAQGHEHTAATGELLFQFLEISLVSLLVYSVWWIKSLKRNMLQSACHLPFVLVSEDEAAVFHQLVERVVGIGSLIPPKVLSVVDVACYLNSHGIGKPHSIHRGVESILADRAGYTRTMEQRGIGKDVVPFYIPMAECTERWVVAVVYNNRIAHGCCRLEIVWAKPVATSYYMACAESELLQVAECCPSHGIVRHTCNVFNIVAKTGERYRNICLWASIVGWE